MRSHLLSLLGLVSLVAGIGCNKVTTEGEPLDLQVWARGFQGSNGYVVPTAIASGPDGSVLLGGTFSTNVDFGGGNLVNDSGSAVFVAHLDQDGNHLFSGSTGSNDSVSSVAVGPDGDLYVAGNYDGAINFGSGKLTGYKNGYLAAFEAGGASDFSMALGGSAEDWVDDMKVTPSGNIVVAARAGDDTNFGGGAQSLQYSHKDAVVVAYSPAGKHLWEVRIPDAWSGVLSLATDAAGNVIVTGLSYNTIQLGPMTVQDGGTFIAKISATGTPLWLQAAKAVDGTYPYFLGAATGPDGSVVVSGSRYYGQFSIGGFSSGGDFNGGTFWLSLSADGEVTGLHEVQTYTYYQSPLIAVAPSGEVVVGLTSDEPVDFGGGQLGSGPLQNVFLARYTSGGEHLESIEIEGTNNEYLVDLAVDPDGHALITGSFDGSIQLGGTELTADEGSATFVARVDF